MPDFFAIDLGTSNCAIKHFSIREISDLLTPKKQMENNVISIPFYYELDEYDEKERCFKDSSELTEIQIDRLVPQRVGFIRRARANGAVAYGEETIAKCDALMLMPSVVRPFRPAPEAAEVYLTGRPALAEYEKNQFRGVLYENTKSLLDQHVEAQGLDAVDIAKHLLRTCFKSIKYYKDKRKIEGGKIAITYPASRNQREYLDNLRAAAREAAIEAGLIEKGAHDDFFITTQEPYAAVLHLVFNDTARYNDEMFENGITTADLALNEAGDKVVLVVDLGGGTSDICLTILRSTGGNPAGLCTYPEYTMKNGLQINCAVNLSGNFGGADFDRLLASRLLQAVKGGDAEPLEKAHPEQQGPALNQAREMKHFFSDKPEETEFEINLANVGGGSTFITRTQYEAWIAPYIESRRMVDNTKEELLYKRLTDDPNTTTSIKAMILQTLKQANPKADFSCVDFVYLTGGTSRMPEMKALIDDLIIGTNCKRINSKDCFFDIAAGAALYAALNAQTQAGVNYSSYTPAPRSSIALMCDGENGKEPKVLIDHSAAIDGQERHIPEAFVVTSTLCKWLQLFTGTSCTHPNFSKLQLLRIELKGKAVEGTKLDLYYKIDQNMRAAMSVGFTDANGEYVKLPMDSIHLDGTREVSSDDGEEIQRVDIARGIEGVVHVRGDHLLTTVTTHDEASEKLVMAKRYLDRLYRLQEGVMGAAAAQDAVKQMALNHLDVLCYAVMLDVHNICGFNNDEIQRFCGEMLPDLICAAVNSLPENDTEALESFSRTLHRMLCHWPNSQRWQVVSTVLNNLYRSVKVAAKYKTKITAAFCASQLRDPLGWRSSTRSPAFDALMERARRMQDEAYNIFAYVFNFFAEYAGLGKLGIALPQTLGLDNSLMSNALASFSDDLKQRIMILRERSLAEAAEDRRRDMEALTRCFKAIREDNTWIETLNSRMRDNVEQNIAAVIEVVKDLQPKEIRDDRHLLSPRCLQSFGIILQRNDDALNERACRGLFHILLSHSCETGETRQPALDALASVPDSETDAVQHLYYKISEAVRAIFSEEFSQELFDELLQARKDAEAHGDARKSSAVWPVWKQFLNNKHFNPKFKEFMGSKLVLPRPGELPDAAQVRDVLMCVYFAYHKDARESVNMNVLKFAVPHQQIAQYLLAVTDLNERSRTRRNNAEMNIITNAALLMFQDLIAANFYEQHYQTLFNRLHVYYAERNPYYADMISRIMDKNQRVGS